MEKRRQAEIALKVQGACPSSGRYKLLKRQLNRMQGNLMKCICQKGGMGQTLVKGMNALKSKPWVAFMWEGETVVCLLLVIR